MNARSSMLAEFRENEVNGAPNERVSNTVTTPVKEPVASRLEEGEYAIDWMASEVDTLPPLLEEGC